MDEAETFSTDVTYKRFDFVVHIINVDFQVISVAKTLWANLALMGPYVVVNCCNVVSYISWAGQLLLADWALMGWYFLVDNPNVFV